MQITWARSVRLFRTYSGTYSVKLRFRDLVYRRSNRFFCFDNTFRGPTVFGPTLARDADTGARGRVGLCSRAFHLRPRPYRTNAADDSDLRRRRRRRRRLRTVNNSTVDLRYTRGTGRRSRRTSALIDGSRYRYDKSCVLVFRTSFTSAHGDPARRSEAQSNGSTAETGFYVCESDRVRRRGFIRVR